MPAQSVACTTSDHCPGLKREAATALPADTGTLRPPLDTSTATEDGAGSSLSCAVKSTGINSELEYVRPPAGESIEIVGGVVSINRRTPVLIIAA